MFINVEDDEALWRYLSPEKFEKLLNSKNIYCQKISKFEDPWEGHVSKFENEREMRCLIAEASSRGFLAGRSDTEINVAVDKLDKSDRSFDRSRYVSCWHRNQCESAAMWDLYCNRNSGVAIVTTGKALRELAERNRAEHGAIFAAVEYLNYESDSVLSNKRDPAFCKRLNFMHEQEARLV